MQPRKTISPGISVEGPQTCGKCRRVPPSIACGCVDPPVFICRTCYGDHIFDEGSHIPTPLPNAPRASMPTRLEDRADPESTRPDFPCSSCGGQAKSVCCCQLPVKQLCELCAEDHMQSGQEKEHLLLPIRAAVHLKTREAIGKLRRRMTQIDLAKEKVSALLEKMDTADSEISVALDSLMQEVQTCKAAKHAKVQEIKNIFTRASEEALVEVEEHIFEDSYTPTSRLAFELFNYREDCSESLMSVFRYSCDLDKAIAGLGQMTSLSLKLTHVTEDSKTYANCLPVVTSTSVRMFDVQTKSNIKYMLLSQPISINDSSAWLFVGDGIIFACGRMQPLSASVYQISVETGEVAVKRSMKVARHSHGIGYYKRTHKIYVFGGTGGSPEAFLKSCEVYDPHLDQWTDSNGSMKEGRDCFNPVLHEDKFFLVGGRNARTIELFSTVNEAVTQMQVQLPYATSTTAIVDEGEVVILQRDKIIRWKVMTSELKTASIRDGTHMYSNTPPLQFNGEAWILRCLTSTVLTVGLGKAGRAEAVQCQRTTLVY